VGSKQYEVSSNHIAKEAPNLGVHTHNSVQSGVSEIPSLSS